MFLFHLSKEFMSSLLLLPGTMCSYGSCYMKNSPGMTFCSHSLQAYGSQSAPQCLFSPSCCQHSISWVVTMVMQKLMVLQDMASVIHCTMSLEYSASKVC